MPDNQHSVSADQIREKIELAVVELIKDKLDDGSMSEERSQAISQMVLNKLKPGMTLEELYKVVPTLDDQFNELSPIVKPLLAEYETQVVSAARDNVSELIRQGQYDAAIKMANNAINQEVKLTYTGSGKPA